jgi:starvation-inducible DNA-binding protein
MNTSRFEPEHTREQDLAWNDETETVREISTTLNALLADLFTLFVKTKNFRWHVSGPHLPSYYLMFGEQANQLLEDLDLVAERVRKIGGSTIHSVEHVLRLARLLGNDADAISPPNMLNELRLDNRRLTGFLRDAHLICTDYVDIASASVLQTLIDNAERRTWFLTETIRLT